MAAMHHSAGQEGFTLLEMNAIARGVVERHRESAALRAGVSSGLVWVGLIAGRGRAFEPTLRAVFRKKTFLSICARPAGETTPE